MASKLRLSNDLSLPIADAPTQTISILGRRGSGKTYTAAVFVEELLEAGLQVVVVDPLDVWFGLRTSADGKGDGYPIIIAGGHHGDVPLEPGAGKLLADLVVDDGVSVVFSLRHLSKQAQRDFVAAFGERLYDRKGEDRHRTQLHLVIDEADAFVPQRLYPGVERAFGAIDTLVRRGRSSGIGTTLISQRAAVLSKDVLTQTEVLVAHQTTGPQDRKALEAWIEAHDTEGHQKEFMTSLASLPRGTAWFWSPGWLDIFRRVEIRRRRTFDSSATPKPGTRPAEPKRLAPVDLERLKSKIAATIERAKADDPRELRKRIAELEAAAKKAAAKPTTAPPAPKAERVEVPVLKETQIKRLEAVAERLAAACESLRAVAGEVLTEVRRASAPQTVTRPMPVPPPRVAPPPPPGRPRTTTESDATVGTGGLRRILIALAQRPGLTNRQIGVRAGISSKSGTFSTYLSRGRTQGWIRDDGDRRYITDDGIAALGHYDPLPEGSALLGYWLNQLGGGAERILRALADAYPQGLSNAELGERANISHVSGTFSTYLSRLRTLELVGGGRGELRASEELFG